ncbi:MAG: murein biosynthesis integral membrane protein MurJ [Candidatus Dojkabacteria bacterium]
MVWRAISNIKNILVRQQTEIVSIAFMLAIIGLATKFFGLLFNSLAAGYLGTEAYNQFIFAANIPELITQIILFGTISASVLPILSSVLEEKGQARLARVFSTLINMSLVVFVIISVLIAIGAGWLMPWLIENVIRPETPITKEQMDELVMMLRVMMIPQVILAISIYLSTVLNLFERFLVPQLAPLFYNLGRIAAIYLFIPILGASPWVLVWGTVIGSVVHLLIQIPLVRYVGLAYKPVIDTGDYYIHRIGTVAVPRIGSMSAEQIGIAVDRFIAFGLVGSSLAFYNLAVLIISVPLSLIGSSFATASFPVLAKAFAKNDRILASQIFTRILNQVLFFSIPAAILILVLRVPISRLSFGIFGDEIGFFETYSIAWVLLFFAPGIVFESLRSLLYRAFYAAHDTLRPLAISFVLLVGGITSGILLTNYFSHFDQFNIFALEFNLEYFFERESGVAAVAGLALSSSIMFTIEALLLIAWLNRRYLHLHWRELVMPILRKLFAGFAMFIFAYFTYKIWAGLETSERTLPLILLSATTSISSLMIYIGASGILRVQEVQVYLDFLGKHPNINSTKKLIKRFLTFDPIPETY